VAISAFFSAVTSFLMYISGRSLQHIVYWVMGAFWNAGWSDVYLMLPFAVLGSLAILAFSRDLNVLLLGDESAAHLGTNVGGIKVGMLALTSLIAAAAVSVSGIIGFVGLVIPHMMRILVGPDHRILVPSSVLMGAMFMVSADTFSRMIVQPTEIPVGIITALIGAPFFIYLLVRKKKGVTG
jgi:iron complex transport system permease protein